MAHWSMSEAPISCGAESMSRPTRESTNTLTPLTYRPDIDGLRGLSILSVIVFHYFPRVAPGGFVGVDVFFVISGFLISGIILKSLKAGSFSYATFYGRRIKRIFPSLVTILVVSLAAGWVFLFPSDWRALGKHVFAGAAFLSNIALMREGGYFDSSAKPLLHLWSLGVEEQFYIIWPLLLVFVFRKRAATLPSILLVLGISLSLNLWYVDKKPSADFYFPAMRIWELALGASLAYVAMFLREKNGSGSSPTELLENRHVRFALSLAGMSLLLVSLIFVNENKPFPGWQALLPTLGASLAIAAGPSAWFNRVALSSRPMVFLGLISYPLYLWHWPLLVFTKILTPGKLTWPLGVAAILVSISMAWLTYELVETPLRHHKSTVAVPCLLASAVGLIGLAGLIGRAVVQPRLQKNGSLVEAAAADWEYPFSGNFGKNADFHTGSLTGRPDEQVLFIGDSHMEQYYSRIKSQMARHPGQFPTAVFATYGLCPPLPGIRSRHGYACDKFFDFALGQANNPLVKTVVFSAFWENYFGYETDGDKTTKVYRADDALRMKGPGMPLAVQEFDEFGSSIRSLRSQGKRVFIILSNPTSIVFDPKKMVSHFTGAFHARDLEISELRTSRLILDRLKAVGVQCGAIVIDPVPYLCNATTCKTTSEQGLPLYKDDNHLRSSYVADHATFIDEIYKN